MNPFTKSTKEKNNVKVNVWDWSHYNNFTTEIGRLTPVFCRRVPAKTSLSIKPTFGLKFMPMMFPIQSNIKARISFFKMPVRALWDGYKDWISSVNSKAADGTDLATKRVPPFLSISNNMTSEGFSRYFGTCSDADLMGLPTTLDSVAPSWSNAGNQRYILNVDKSFPADNTCTPTGNNTSTAVMRDITSGSFTSLESTDFLTACTPFINPKGSFSMGKGSSFSFNLNLSPLSALLFDIASASFSIVYGGWKGTSSEGFSLCLHDSFDVSPDIVTRFGAHFSVSLPFDVTADSSLTSSWFFLHINVPSDKKLIYNGSTSTGSIISNVAVDNYAPLYSLSSCPWYNRDTGSGLKISSLPFRMREAVYNAYIRDIRNNPLLVNGTPIYNEWVLCRTMDGDDGLNYETKIGSSGASINGESNREYFLGRKYVNWEPDYLSTAVQSPQQGIAPLVGLTTYSSVVSTDANGLTTSKLNSVLTDEDGNSYQVNYVADKEGLKGVTYTELSATDEMGTPLNNLYQAISQGISIEDFRMVNAYQRYLELNMRRGYSYKDIVEGRYDVNVRFDELLMPEFCGGFTRDVVVSPVTQTVETQTSGSYQGALGSQAGDAFVRGDSDANIRIYCDEDSIVMGFMSVSPLPIYSQNLLKDWLIRDQLDVISPEFLQIGYQPIPLSEVAPIQAFNNGADLNSTFGYQRPWYHLLSMPDQAHGLFRSQLQNFIMKRTYSGVPALTKEFLLVKPEQVNQVFSVTETTDKIFGQIGFSIRCKNIVPRDATPRLE